jgi:hypothetical protein
VEDLSRNLFSTSAVTRKGMTVTLANNGCEIVSNGQIVATGVQHGNLTYLNVMEEPEANHAELEDQLWHRRFGHVSNSSLKKMKNNGLLPEGVEPGKVGSICETCAIAKQSKMKFPANENEDKKTKGLVCSDIMGPVTPSTISGNSYAVTFIMMDTRFTKIYLMKKKDEMLNKFKEFQDDMKTQVGFKVKILRSDNGGEYRSHSMKDYCKKNGIRQEFTIPHNPEQNGMAERANRTLIEMTRCMLQDSGMKKQYWGEAIMTAAHIRNMVSTKQHPETTPYQATYKNKPNHLSLKIFGSICYAHVPKATRKKLDNTGIKCRFLGYSEDQKGYRLLQEDTNKIIYSRSIIWNETNQPVISQRHEVNFEETVAPIKEEMGQENKIPARNAQQSDEYISDQEQDDPDNEPAQDVPATPPRTRSQTRQMAQVTQQSKTPNRFGEYEPSVRPARKKKAITRYQDEYDSLICLLSEVNDEDANSYEEIKKSSSYNQWKIAMDAEMASIKAHQTWKLTELPSGVKAIGCRWLFKIKKNPDGSVDRYKARLCAKGFTQKFGVDFNETFAPVAKSTSIRTMLAIGAELDLEIQQFDVDTAFLYGEMDNPVYMVQPSGYEDPEHPEWVCLLLKSLYGTKQAARQWNEALDNHMQDQGFEVSSADPCIYYKISSSEYTVIAVYVDDIIAMSNNMVNINEFKSKIKKSFKIKDLGDMKYCLGIEINRNRSKKIITMSQLGYINKIAEKFGLQDCKPIYTPADYNSQLSKRDPDDTRPIEGKYRALVGSIMYAMVCTRPDIANSVGTVAKYCENPSEEHWVAAKRILRYLVTTKNMQLVFGGKGSAELIGYADSNWAADIDTRRSTTGYVFMLNSSLISWKSQRQHTVATSSTEAEYMALYSAVQESIWLRRILKELKQLKDLPTMIYQDNQGTIALAKNPIFHSRSKHIDIKFHFTRDKIQDGVIQVEYKSTQEMVADALTKSVNKVKLQEFIKSVNMQDETRAENKFQEKSSADMKINTIKKQQSHNQGKVMEMTETLL